MLSMPAAAATVAPPVRSRAAASATACSDEAQARLTVHRLVRAASNPTWLSAMRAALEPPSSDSTTPTPTSSTAPRADAGSRSRVAPSTAASSSSG
ncbi:hypothetical protein G6O67_008017 [Ophiocordyceps sinensis]|uniref:Uncharacterized protein n=1 Tax=Ophiocordyceps sinensis TaxID=72228 RepID=A0A8H4PN83_9HYPO|nr:hypothetical protein G6O67_008017 [Ophiocordyceps sinensis]